MTLSLNINDDKQIQSPTSEDLERVLPQVECGQYCILGRGDEQYIQFYHNDDGSFLLEYRDGSREEHFTEASQKLKTDDVVCAFVGYLHNEQQWKTKHEWVRLEFDVDFEGDEFDTHYLLNGKEYGRVRVGGERSPLTEGRGRCPECEVEFGGLHASGCPAEECPRCHERMQTCDCE